MVDDNRVIGVSHEDHLASLTQPPGGERPGWALKSLWNADGNFCGFLECQSAVMEQARQAIAIEHGAARDQSAR
jgi:hypothetical protein